MKIFIMTDMEGVCGVVNFDDWAWPTGRYYENGKRLLTLEVDAAVEGFFNAGADEIVVADGHGAGGINLELLDSRVSYIRSSVGPYPFMLDSSYDAIAWIGQHAKAGTEYAHIPHTGWFDVIDFTINGISVGEFGQMAMMAWSLGVTPILAVGDKAFAAEAESLVTGIETVSVKRGLTPGKGDECDCDAYKKRNLSAMHMHPEKARELIKKGAENALKRYMADRSSFKMEDLKPPFVKTVKYRRSGDEAAYMTCTEHPTNIIELMNMPEKRI